MEQVIENKKKLPSVTKYRWYKIVPLVIQIIVTSISWFLLKIFMNYSVEGLENLTEIKDKTAIFASNHSSELDPIIVTLMLRGTGFLPLFYVSREKSFYANSGWRQLIYGGLIFKMCGAYPVYTGYHDYKKSLVNHISILNSGNSVCIFPEGKRSLSGNIAEAKGGIGYLSYYTNKPVVPIAIMGLYNLKLKYLFFRSRKLKIIVGKPLYPNDLFTDLNNVEVRIGDHVCRNAASIIMDKIKNLIV